MYICNSHIFWWNDSLVSRELKDLHIYIWRFDKLKKESAKFYSHSPMLISVNLIYYLICERQFFILMLSV